MSTAALMNSTVLTSLILTDDASIQVKYLKVCFLSVHHSNFNSITVLCHLHDNLYSLKSVNFFCLYHLFQRKLMLELSM